MSNFKDELNRINADYKRKNRIIDILTMLFICVLICGMIFLFTADLWN